MKTLDQSIVKDIATDLIKANGETTTLDIKREARNRDFWAKQDDVSAMVSGLVSTGNLEVNDDNGNYRTYVTPTVATDDDIHDSTNLLDDDDDDTTATVVPVTTPSTVVIHRDGSSTPVKPITKALTQKGDWEVSSTTDDTIQYYLKDITRDAVRSAYAKLVDVKFVNVRAKKIK